VNRKILLVDDDEVFAYVLAERLRRDSVDLLVASNLHDAWEKATAQAPSLVLIDFQLPDGNGIELARRLAAPPDQEPIPTLMITAFGSIDGAVDAMRSGCVDYVTKERDLGEIALRIRKALELIELRTRVSHFEGALARRLEDSGIDGDSPAIDAARQQIHVAAAAPDTTVLILGESGTGKQLVARAIHAASSRRDRPFVEVDCTTLTAGLTESELFGHERGAFTGADRRKLGLVEMADGGTLLLDEVGELEPASQAKLLRLLQERRFRRVGGVKDHEVDVRILASTNRSLSDEVAAGRFRQDLFYRLRVFVVQLPPLRQRGEDVITLAQRFVREFGRRLGKPDVRLSDRALAALRAYPFPGNVRELRGLIEQAVVRASSTVIDGELLSLPLPAKLARADQPRERGRPRQRLSADEAQRIRHAMELHYGNQSKAAAYLGISRFVLKRKLLLLKDGGARA